MIILKKFWHFRRPVSNFTWTRRNRKFEFRSSSNAKVNSIPGCRLAKIVAESTMKKKTSSGAAELIMALTVAKCGGAVANLARTSLAVGTALTSPRMTMRMKRTPTLVTVISKMTSTFVAHAVKKSVTLLMIVHATQTSKLV